MSCNYLLDQALMRIWSSPRQDTQSITKPKRITSFNGTWNKVDVLRDQYRLPETGVRFHVYQVGQLYPLLMGLFPIRDRWVSLLDACNQQNMVVNVYNDKGIEMPRYSTYYLVTPDKNLLLAVKEQPTIDFNLNEDNLYFRVYSNAYFNSRQFDPTRDYIRVTGKTIATNEDIVELKEKYEKVRNDRMGTPFLYINGRKENILNFNTVERGDCVEFIEDTSIYRFVTFRVKSLRTFDSIKDLMRKYVLHYSTPMKNTDQIDYHDDIDFYVIRKDPALKSPIYTGFYYHRNDEKAVRNLTHRDYSISVPFVTNYTKQKTPYYYEDKSDKEWYIQMYVRRGGWNRNLEFVHNRIKELYKLPDVYVWRALHGIESTVEEWRADNLENSDYMTVMSSPDYNIDKTVVENAWGYNAVSKMTGDTPMKTEFFSGRNTVKVPLILRRYSTAFEYDRQGLYLGYHLHVSGDRYSTRNTNTRLVEMIGGYASNNIDETYNKLYSPYDKEFNYRMYRKEKRPLDGIVRWEDVTDSNHYFINENLGRIEWTHDMSEYDCIVRSDKSILVQEVNDRVRNGLIYIKMKHNASRDGIEKIYDVDVPFGEIDVFLNGYSLVEGVDYYVDFPYVCVVNKTFLINPNTQEQKIVIRQYGFANKDLTRNRKEDSGFVRYGTLSRNNRFDIRDDRVLRINVGGRLIHRDDLGFSESNTAITVSGIRDGHPYELKDILVPLRNIVDQDHEEYRNRSYALDLKISDYMSQFLKDPEKPNVSSIPALWPVYSPFCSNIIFDLINGVLSTEPLKEFYDDNFVLEYTKKYNHLLRVDPTQEHILFDSEFVEVHPTHLTSVVDLNPWQYKFMERVVSLILKNRVDLTSFARIVA